MSTLSRRQHFEALFPETPPFRLTQLERSLFHSGARDWQTVSALPLSTRTLLGTQVPWLSLSPVRVLTSRRQDTHKAIMAAADGARIETVLMKNARGSWSVCVSSQVGCAMACTFCATGKMGFTRNLTSDEIVDQYRFWMYFLTERSVLPPAQNKVRPQEERISNVVFMGMGEPLANYEHVKNSLKTLLAYTDVGPTRITVSTVGLIPMLNKLLEDTKWPPVRLAVSLHSADNDTRKKIMPSSYDGFLDKLAAWAGKYFEKFESRRRHLTFEYIMLSGVNDTPLHAKALARFVNTLGKVRVNLIPYNTTAASYRQSEAARLERFMLHLEGKGVTVTKRRTMGDDIAAACGQLIVENGK